MRAIQAGDDDAMASGVHVGLQSGGLLKIILKANGGTVQSVKDSRGKPLPNCFVRLSWLKTSRRNSRAVTLLPRDATAIKIEASPDDE